MKLTNHEPKDKVEISVQEQQEKEKFLFDGILKPKPNQRVYQLDLRTMKVSEAPYFIEKDTVNYLDVINKKDRRKDRKILVKEGFDYVIKLNMKNAVKHFRKVWADNSICEGDNSNANTLVEKQGKIKKFRNKE